MLTFQSTLSRDEPIESLYQKKEEPGFHFGSLPNEYYWLREHGNGWREIKSYRLLVWPFFKARLLGLLQRKHWNFSYTALSADRINITVSGLAHYEVHDRQTLAKNIAGLGEGLRGVIQHALEQAVGWHLEADIHLRQAEILRFANDKVSAVVERFGARIEIIDLTLISELDSKRRGEVERDIVTEGESRRRNKVIEHVMSLARAMTPPGGDLMQSAIALAPWYFTPDEMRAMEGLLIARIQAEIAASLTQGSNGTRPPTVGPAQPPSGAPRTLAPRSNRDQTDEDPTIAAIQRAFADALIAATVPEAGIPIRYQMRFSDRFAVSFLVEQGRICDVQYGRGNQLRRYMGSIPMRATMEAQLQELIALLRREG